MGAGADSETVQLVTRGEIVSVGHTPKLYDTFAAARSGEYRSPLSAVKP